jgi:hypothetical protein
MKNIRKQILLLSVLLVSAMSYATNNNLIIFSQDGNKFTVILNGLRQNEKPETNVKVTGLNASTYKVKVIFENTALGSFDQTAYLMDGGNEVSNKEFSYSIEQKKKGDWKLKPSSIADIPQTPMNTPDQVVYVFNPSGNATPAQTSSTTISTTTTTTGQTETINVNMNDGTGTTQQTTTTTTTTGDGASVNMNAGGVGINVTITDNMGGATSTTTTTTTTTSSSSTTTSEPVEPVNSATQCYYPMSSADFANAKSSVEKQSFEDGKLKVAKQILSTNCMSVAQVKEIMAMFSYEETKLEWAKFAYGKTTDPNNYYQLNDGFTYSSSVDALNEYIETQK